MFDDDEHEMNIFEDLDEDEYISYVPQQVEIVNRHYVKICEQISDFVSLDINYSAESGGEASRMYRREGRRKNSKNVENLKMSRFSGKAFVTLKYVHFKEYLLTKFSEDPNFLRVNGNKTSLKLSQAGKPNDVYWNNMKI